MYHHKYIQPSKFLNTQVNKKLHLASQVEYSQVVFEHSQRGIVLQMSKKEIILQSIQKPSLAKKNKSSIALSPERGLYYKCPERAFYQKVVRNLSLYKNQKNWVPLSELPHLAYAQAPASFSSSFHVCMSVSHKKKIMNQFR